MISCIANREALKAFNAMERCLLPRLYMFTAIYNIHHQVPMNMITNHLFMN